MRQNSTLPKERQRKACRAKGFTLIELLAVLMIIGVLAALGLPRYFRVVERNRLGEAPTVLQAYKDSIDRSCLKLGGGAAVPPAIANIDMEVGTLKYFTAPVYNGAATCAAFSIQMARTLTDCYTACHTGADCTASLGRMDQASVVTWVNVAAACQP